MAEATVLTVGRTAPAHSPEVTEAHVAGTTFTVVVLVLLSLVTHGL